MPEHAPLPSPTRSSLMHPSLNAPFPTAPMSHNFFNGIYSTIENSLLLYLIQLHNFLYLIIFVIQKKKIGPPRQMPPENNGPANLPFPARHKTAKSR
jgi:hypothetical protein